MERLLELKTIRESTINAAHDHVTDESEEHTWGKVESMFNKQ